MMLSKDKFKRLSKTKQWNYIQYVQSEKGSLLQNLSNSIIMVLAIIAIAFAVLQLKQIEESFLLQGICYVIIFFIIFKISKSNKPKIDLIKNYSKRIKEFSKIYFK